MCELGSRTVSVLPLELQEEIIKRLPAKALLISRLVNHNWKTLATFYCVKKYVSLQPKTNCNRRVDLYSTFLDPNSVPWSACFMYSGFRDNDYSSNMVDIGIKDRFGKNRIIVTTTANTSLPNFINNFGSRIRKLSISGVTHDNFITLLRGVPNLEILKYSAHSLFDRERKISLRGLKRLEMKLLAPHDVQVMEFLTNGATSLEAMQLSLHFRKWHYETINDGRVQADKMVKLIKSIPSISLKLFDGDWDLEILESFTPLRFKQLGFTTLRGHQNAELQRTYYGIIGSMLNNSAEYLEKLSIRDHFTLKKGSSELPEELLQIPPLFKLKYLRLSAWHISNNKDHFLQVVPLTSAQFPLLDKLVLDGWDLGNFAVLEDAQFESVSQLSVKAYGGQTPLNPLTDYSRICPNLRKLEVEGWKPVSRASLQYIFTRMKTLTHLQINTGSRHWNTIASAFFNDVPDIVPLPSFNQLALFTFEMDNRCYRFNQNDTEVNEAVVTELELRDFFNTLPQLKNVPVEVKFREDGDLFGPNQYDL